MDSTSPLYRQLTSRFSLLFLSFVLIFFVGFSFYYQYEQDLTQFKYQQLPAIEKFNQRQQLLIKSDRLLSDVISSQYATNFTDNFATLTENIEKISDVNRSNRRLLEQLIQRLKAQSENVALLTENERRNIQLKDNVIIQLTLTVDNLANVISQQSAAEKILNRQINQEKSSIRLKTNRVNAYSRLLASLKINHELHLSLVETLVMFNQLDLQYDLAEFDYIKHIVHRDISYWLESNLMLSEEPNENALTEQILILNALLFSEQNTLAKWRGQLRMAIDLQSELTKQRMELAPFLDKTLVIQPLKSTVIEKKLLAWLGMVNVNLQPQYYIWLVFGVFIFIAVVFISLLISLRRKVKHMGSQSITVVEELVKTGQVSSQVPTLEVSAIINTINQLSKPLHTEVDFQSQKQQFQARNALMSRHTGNVYWQIPIVSKTMQRKVSALLAGEPNNKHWRQFFSRADVRTILISARAAKKSQSIQKISLTSNQEKAIALTIEYIDGIWCGSICNIEEYRVLKDESTQLQHQLKEQNQTDKLAIIAGSEEVLGIVSHVMVSKQKLLLTQDNESFVYHQLQEIINWSERQRTCAQLRRDDFVLALSSVSLTNEIHTVLTNVSFSQAANNNQVYVRLDDNLASLVTLESELFQAMLATLCQKMFTDQHGAELDIELNVIEVNSAQQMVQVSFIINHASRLKSLLQVVNELALNEDLNINYDSATDNYLRDLQLVFNVTNKVGQLFDEGGKFSFDMPFALAEGVNKQRIDKTARLVKRSLLVIATDKANRERICRALSNSKAVVETMQDLLLFQRQISIKYLTKYPIDVIILSPEVYLTDYDLITQHLASLPSKLQPKILVLQPFNCKELQRAGLFSQCNLPWFGETLMVNVEQLFNSESKLNLIVEPEMFSPYRFVESQVEVLVALVDVDKSQALIRIMQWLGLQVTLVSQQEQLERLWQSGRFLLVISEFTDFTVVINESISVSRGVFILNQNAANKTDVLEKCNVLNALHAEYNVEPLAPILDIQKLNEQLMPWLISRAVANATKGLQAPIAVQEHKQPVNFNNNKALTSVEPEINIADVDPLFDFELDTKHEQGSTLSNGAFDLMQFAQNQGSAELAAFMLDDYVADITADSQILFTAIDEQNVDMAKQSLMSLIKVAKVIAARPLIAQCEALSQMLNNDNADSESPVKQLEGLEEQLIHLRQCIVELTEFAEVI